VNFIDSGHNVLLAGGVNTSEPSRELANEVGLDFDEPKSAVIDHHNYDELDSDHLHTLIAVSTVLDAPSVLGKKITDPILFRGIGHASSVESSPLIVKLLTGAQTTYSHIPKQKVDVYPQSIGDDTLLVTAIQTRNSARVVVTGSVDLFSNKFFAASVQLAGSSKKVKSGNEQFATEVSKWLFQEKSHLRATKLTHHQQGSKDLNPRSYRIKDDIEFSVLIEEYDGAQHKWIPFTKNDVQLEFTMIDPYIRTTLKHDGKGVFSTKFKIPDVYGVFKFVINYHRLGYTNLELSEQVSVNPYRHNDYDRFIPAAYPYYASAFSTMGGFFLFGLAFLFYKEPSKQHTQ